MERPPPKPKKTKGAAPREENAPSKQHKAKLINCDTHAISKLRRELQRAGLALRDTSGHSQRETLIGVLQYLGARGFNTKEAEGCGYYRIATRIHELEGAGWHIAVPKESIIGVDGLIHNGIARYTLLGRLPDAQGKLDLGE